MVRLKGKVAVVTGGAQGIGKAVVLAMAREGAAVAIVDLNLDKARAVARQAEELGARALALQGDVADRADVERVFQECVERLGQVDVLVNNAAIGAPTKGLGVSEDDWDRVVDVNLKSVFLCSRLAVPAMAERGWGRVINVSSTGAFNGTSVGDMPYAASKAGMIGLTRAMARWLAPRGITVNAIAPGPIDTETPVKPGRRTPEEWQQLVAGSCPMGRLGSPEEVARVALFLASEDSSFVTGATISVSGGYLLH